MKVLSTKFGMNLILTPEKCHLFGLEFPHIGLPRIDFETAKAN